MLPAFQVIIGDICPYAQKGHKREVSFVVPSVYCERIENKG